MCQKLISITKQLPHKILEKMFGVLNIFLPIHSPTRTQSGTSSTGKTQNSDLHYSMSYMHKMCFNNCDIHSYMSNSSNILPFMNFNCIFNLRDRNRFDISLLIDSGYIASIFSREFRHIVLNRQEKRHLLAVNGTPISVCGSIPVTIHIDGSPYTHSFLVADVGCSILGYDFLSHHGITICTSPL